MMIDTHRPIGERGAAMKRAILGILAGAVVLAAVAWSKPPLVLPTTTPALQVTSEARNPWTHLRLNNNPDDFQFVVISDRTGGHREKVFSKAIEQINLLQPEFVLSVGDLIEGYTEDSDRVANEWREFQGFVSKLHMPFFYVPGNHDVTNPYMEKVWQEKFGRRYYHFVYREVLFLVLNSDDPPKSSKLSAAQVAYVKQALADNAKVRWTIVALHKPIWSHADVETNGWLEVEKLLNDRPYTVFAGHVHRFKKFVRNGRNHYQLATTGGGSRLRGLKYGEFDHVVWVTMKPTGPVLANIMLDGIYPESLKLTETIEPGYDYPKIERYPVSGTVYYNGTPAVGATIVFYLQVPETKKLRRLADAIVEADGTFRLTTLTPNDGAPVGEYRITVVQDSEYVDEDSLPRKNLLPLKYATPLTSGLSATIKDGRNEFKFELTK
jgi:predicted phosphodiesterase